MTNALLAAAALFTVLPLFPALSPSWPRGNLPLATLLLAAVTVTAAILRLRRSGRLDGRTLLLGGAFPLYALYTGNAAHHSSGDNLATIYIGPELLTRGTLDLSPLFPPQRGRVAYSMVLEGGRVLPRSPLGTPFLALPHTAVAVAASGRRLDLDLARRWEKHAAALLTVAAVALLFLGVRRRFGDAAAIGAASVFGLATTLPSTTGQALWTFTGEVFFLALALFLLLDETPSARRAFAGGTALGAAFLCRPTALVASLALGLVAARRGRRDTAAFAVGAVVSLAAVCLFQLSLYGHPLGAYGASNTAGTEWAASPAEGLLGTLVSPSRGALPFFPYLLLLPAAIPAVRRDRSLAIPWLGALSALFGTYLLASLYGKWWGGHALGPRLLTEAAPFLAMLTVPLWQGKAKGGAVLRAALVVTVSFAAVTQLLLTYSPRTGNWSGDVDVDTHRSFLWSWRNGQLAAAWIPGWKVDAGFARLLPALSGEPDDSLTGSVDAPAEGSEVKGRLLVRGWARIPGQDLAVDVLLDDDPRNHPRLVRVPRPEVAAALPGLGDCAGAGWEAVFEGVPAKAGLHEVRAIFRSADGRYRVYPTRRFRWSP